MLTSIIELVSRSAAVDPVLPSPPVSSHGLTMKQQEVIVTIQRTMSILSMSATSIIIICFLAMRELRLKPFNRLLFLASWGNILANVATVIGRSGINKGVSSPLCRTQATLIQW
jgi:hypothetical protein